MSAAPVRAAAEPRAAPSTGEPPSTHRPRLPLDPRGLSREVAAGYVGVSPSLFMMMVDDGRMPRPRVANARRIWDRRELDEAIDALPHDGEAPGRNEWDSVL